MWAMPHFQSSAASSLGVVGPYTATGNCGSAACREVPDVSADADPSTGAVTYAATGSNGTGGSSWSVAGGTSVSAPLWAGFAALTNVQASCRHLPVGDINPSLYALASADYPARSPATRATTRPAPIPASIRSAPDTTSPPAWARR
jgi:kumamolisin